ncbi:MAG: pitrilysin family protein [Rickettsiales bacterium]
MGFYRLVLSTFLIIICIGFFQPVFALSKITSSTFTLKNGLKVVVIPQHRIPAVAHIIFFHAGSSDDPPGHSGVAHYLEHMMFKGTKKYPEGQYDHIIERMGGTQNAFTSRDMTAYYAVVASEHLEKVMELESDRFENWQPSEKTFRSERDVITEERRTRVDNDPSAQLGEAILAALYRNHPYHTPLIGWMHEIQRLGLEDIERFFRGHYSPNNAMLLLVGDITPEKAKTLAEKYYNNWKKTPLLPRIMREEPPRITAETIVLKHPEVRQPQWSRTYDAPSLLYGDKSLVVPLIVLEQVLGGGQTSLLYQELVVKRKIATDADADYSGYTIGPSPFSVDITPAASVTFDQIDAAYRDVLRDVKLNGVDPAALARAKNLMKASSIYSRDGLERLAFNIGQLYMLGLDENWLENWPEIIDAVTNDQIKQAATSVLVNDLSITAYLLPKAEANARKH